MTASPKISRRNLIQGFAHGATAAVGLAAIATPASASDEASQSDNELLKLLDDWRVAYDGSMDEPEGVEYHYKRMISLQDEIAEIVPHSAMGFAVKILILTNYGEYSLADNELSAVVLDAERITRIPAPKRLQEWRNGTGKYEGRNLSSEIDISDLERFGMGTGAFPVS